jgi:hypothetical protein
LTLKHAIFAGALLLAMHAGAARADGTFIAAANRTDMVYDSQRDLIYIANGTSVLRYDLTQGGFLTPIVLGGSLEGVDLSPDGNTLAVADASNDGTNEWVHLVNLTTLVDAKAILPFPAAGGTEAVAYCADGSLIVTSVWSLQRLNPSTGQWTSVSLAPGTTNSGASMVSASGDGQTIASTQSGSEPSFWGIYDVATNQFSLSEPIIWDTYEIATNTNGGQFAVPTYFGTFIYDNANNLLATLGTYAGEQPIGVAYHPVENEVFFPWAETGEVRVYDTSTFNELGSYDFQDTFQTPGNTALVQGRTRLSPDGSLLMVTVTGGVRFLRIYSPLAATPIQAPGPEGVAASIPLEGFIGNNGALSYTLGTPPTHGNVTIAGKIATYVPAHNAIEPDVFTYVVHYGRATAVGTVSVGSRKSSPVKPNPPIVVLQ